MTKIANMQAKWYARFPLMSPVSAEPSCSYQLQKIALMPTEFKPSRRRAFNNSGMPRRSVIM